MAVNILLELDGVTGESQVAEGSIDVLSFSWGATQSGTTHMGSGAGSGKADFQDLSIVKYVDSSSGTLLQFLSEGKHIATGKLTLKKAGAPAIDYEIYELEELIITSLSKGGTGDADRITESISLNFRKFHYQYFMQTAEGTAENKGDYTWDISKQTS
jgi:type VI secretion system secreted protein Hcp